VNELMPKYYWQYMGTHPATGELRFMGDVDELPVEVGARLVASGHCVPVPDEVPAQLTPRDEPSMLIGINITEEEFVRGERVREARSKGIPTVSRASANETRAKDG
jgi:hypothetical protein